jgi:hypothetical protein
MILINGPARCFKNEKTFNPWTREFQIHFLVGGKPACGFSSKYEFIKMSVSLDEITDWKKCPECFKYYR